jgi:hypothetical protein
MKLAEKEHPGFRLQFAHILEALATAAAASIQERRNTLHLALVAFDHDDTDAHDAASSGIVLLTRCFQKDHNQWSADAVADDDEESAALTTSYLRLIGMMFRCSDEKAVSAVYRIGADLISLMVSLFYKLQGQPAVASSIRTLVDRLATLSVSLTAIDKKELLVRLMQRVVRGEYECRELLSIALQLTSGCARHPDSKRYIMNLPGLVEDILAVALQPPLEASLPGETNGDADAVSLHVASFLSHLVWDVRSKSELVHKKGFLQAVLRLLTYNKGACTSAAVVRAAIDVLRQLATEAGCRVAICKHDKGDILRALLTTMDDPELSDAVNHTLLRLIGQDTAVLLLKKQSNIIERLTHSARVDMDCTHGKNASVLAAQALKRFASYVSVRNRSHPNLLDALTSLATAQNSQIRFWAVKGLLEQSKSSTGRFYIARTGDALPILIRLAKIDPCQSVKSAATDTLLLLALDAANAKRLASNSEVLETFAETAKCARECQSSARSAIQAILSLTCHNTTNKQRVAKTLGLVESLSCYGVSQDADTELKRAALHCVIVLAPLM